MNIFNLTSSSVSDDSRVFDLLALEERGLTCDELQLVAKRHGFSAELLASILAISLRTYQRRLEQKKGLTSSETGALIEVLQIINFGIEVFEDKGKLMRWLELPNKTLRGKKPEDLMILASGRKLIMNVLGRIDYGVYS